MVREPLEAAPVPRAGCGPHESAGPQAGTVQRTSAVQWAAQPERGSALLLTLMIFLANRLGRPPGRPSRT